MAKKPAAKKKKAAPKKGGGGVAQYILLIVGFIAMAKFALPSVLVLLAAMLPTLVALVVERGKNRYAWVCVGGSSFAATCPYLFQLWHDGQTIAAAVDILSSVPAWLVMYSGAAFGWGLYTATPPVVGVFIDFLIKRRIAAQQVIQRRLVEQWGDAITKVEAEPADGKGKRRPVR